MKRFWVFAGSCEGPIGGWHEFIGDTGSLGEAADLIAKAGDRPDSEQPIMGYGWYQIIDTEIAKKPGWHGLKRFMVFADFPRWRGGWHDLYISCDTLNEATQIAEANANVDYHIMDRDTGEFVRTGVKTDDGWERCEWRE